MRLTFKLDKSICEFQWLKPYLDDFPDEIILWDTNYSDKVKYKATINGIKFAFTAGFGVKCKYTIGLIGIKSYSKVGFSECLEKLERRYDTLITESRSNPFRILPDYPPDHPARNYPLFQLIEMDSIEFISRSWKDYYISPSDKIKYSGEVIFEDWRSGGDLLMMFLDGNMPESFCHGYKPIMAKRALPTS